MENHKSDETQPSGYRKPLERDNARDLLDYVNIVATFILGLAACAIGYLSYVEASQSATQATNDTATAAFLADPNIADICGNSGSTAPVEVQVYAGLWPSDQPNFVNIINARQAHCGVQRTLAAPPDNARPADGSTEESKVISEGKLPSIYIQYSDNTPSAQLKNLQDLLSNAGYTVPAAQHVSNSILPDSPQVRFYFSEQSDEGKQLVNLIEAKVSGLENVKESGPLSSTFHSLPQGVLEFWFGK